MIHCKNKVRGRVVLKWICSRQASLFFLAVMLIAVIALSLTPHPESILGRFSLYDKAEHFAAYVLLSFFATRSIGRRDALSLAVAIAACAAFGGLIEIIQPYVGRSRELADFLVDLGGAAVGAAIASCMMRKGREG
jgi:VanZ family protein